MPVIDSTKEPQPEDDDVQPAERVVVVALPSSINRGKGNALHQRVKEGNES